MSSPYYFALANSIYTSSYYVNVEPYYIYLSNYLTNEWSWWSISNFLTAEIFYNEPINFYLNVLESPSDLADSTINLGNAGIAY